MSKGSQYIGYFVMNNVTPALKKMFDPKNLPTIWRTEDTKSWGTEDNLYQITKSTLTSLFCNTQTPQFALILTKRPPTLKKGRLRHENMILEPK